MPATRPASLCRTCPAESMGWSSSTCKIPKFHTFSPFSCAKREQGLDLVMKYQTPDISDSGKTFLENKEAMKALLNKYPEFREIAGNLVARAVAPSGQDFGSELPIKDIK